MFVTHWLGTIAVKDVEETGKGTANSILFAYVNHFIYKYVQF